MTDKSARDFLMSFENISKDLKKHLKTIKLDKKNRCRNIITYTPWTLAVDIIMNYLATLKTPEKLMVLMLLIKKDDDLIVCDEIFKLVDDTIVALIIDQVFYR